MDADFNMFQSYLNGSREERGVFARFYDKYIRTGEIDDNGLPKFAVKTYVEIRIQNSADVADHPAGEQDLMRFPKEYALYQVKKEKVKQGTPLAQFAFLTVPEIATCELRGIFTVEDLAGLTDEKAKEINILTAKEQAVKFLEASKNNKAIAKFEAENKKLKEKIAKLEDELKALKEK